MHTWRDFYQTIAKLGEVLRTPHARMMFRIRSEYDGFKSVCVDHVLVHNDQGKGDAYVQTWDSGRQAWECANGWHTSMNGGDPICTRCGHDDGPDRERMKNITFRRVE